MTGRWKNIEELEESLTLEELELIVKSSREKEHRLMKFYAAFKGVNIDEEEKEDVQDRFERAQRRAEARLAGLTEEEIEQAEEQSSFADFGLEVETIE